MIFPRQVRERCIAELSFKRSPVALVWSAFSDPERSTKLMIESFSPFFPPNLVIYLNSIVITVWARELELFIAVLPIDLFLVAI